MTALRALLAHLIDYAGLFPPAGLGMETAVRNYARYTKCEHAWMLGRFVVPASRLTEFEDACSRVGTSEGWRVAMLGMPEQSCRAGRTVVDTVELKAENPEAIANAVVPSAAASYFEIPIRNDPSALLEALARARKNAKIRTGGLSADMFPGSPDIARFLVCSAKNRVAFKATAGLHHPIRSVHRFTYDIDSPSGLMHGFVNVALAAALVYAGGDQQQAAATLEETSPSAFQFAEECVRWHGHHLQADQIRAAREKFMVSFGSCSFEEPLNDLAALGWL